LRGSPRDYRLRIHHTANISSRLQSAPHRAARDRGQADHTPAALLFLPGIPGVAVLASRAVATDDLRVCWTAPGSDDFHQRRDGLRATWPSLVDLVQVESEISDRAV
jgi:hypothetical protein